MIVLGLLPDLTGMDRIRWYSLEVQPENRVSGTVLVDHGNSDFVAYDVVFDLQGPTSALFKLDISASEDTSPLSSAPSHGWIGWLEGHLVVAWQNREAMFQHTVTWPDRSPFSEGDESTENLEGFARIAAAIQRFEFDDLGAAMKYLPVRG